MNVFIFLLLITPIFFASKKIWRSDPTSSAVKFFLIGYIFYAGICVLVSDIPNYYVWMYLIFSLAFIFAFSLSYKLLYKIGKSSGVFYNQFIKEFFTRRTKSLIIVFYVGLSLFPLLLPDFRIFELLSPQPPDLRAAFFARYENTEKSAILSLALLLKQLLLPFFLISLYDGSKKLLFPFFVLTIVFYIEYVVAGYKSRGELIVNYFPLFFFYWCNFPRRRVAVVSVGLVLSPLVLMFFGFYEIYRLDSSASVNQFQVFETAENILRTETGFVEAVGIPLIESNRQIDILDYFKWIFTLPLPKFIFGEIAGARINTEISEIILGVSRGANNFYIVLPGLISESVYIYGMNFFWVHALTLGVFFALLFRLFSNNNELIFLMGYITAVAAYSLNRGGVASFLPQMVNQLFVLYIIYIGYLFKFNPRSYRKT